MRIVSALVVGLTIAAPLPALAYTAAEAKACMSDAFRLCAKAIPNQGRVAACLQTKQQQLSAGCAEALARYMRTQSEPGHGPTAVYQE
jgi:hypothetical protein